MFSTAYLPLVGGAELALKEITDRIPELSFDLVTARLRSDLLDEEYIGNVHVYRVGSPWLFRSFLLPKLLFPFMAYWKARSLAKSHSYGIMLALQASQGGGAAWLFKIFNPQIRFVLNVQEGKDLAKQNVILRYIRALIIKKADVVTVISNYLAEVIGHLGVPMEKIHLIPNGVDLQRFDRHIDNDTLLDLRERLGIKPHDKVMISVSRLVAKNGLADLIKSFKRFDRDDVKLLLVGDGDQYDELTLLSKQLGIKDKVIFAGTIGHEQLTSYLKIADVFVRPSVSEGLGTAFLEAMAARIPVVAAPVGGIPDFLKDRETGLFVALDDRLNSASIAGILLGDKALRQTIIDNAYAMVVKHYQWQDIAKRYRDIFTN